MITLFFLGTYILKPVKKNIPTIKTKPQKKYFLPERCDPLLSALGGSVGGGGEGVLTPPGTGDGVLTPSESGCREPIDLDFTFWINKIIFSLT